MCGFRRKHGRLSSWRFCHADNSCTRASGGAGLTTKKEPLFFKAVSKHIEHTGCRRDCFFVQDRFNELLKLCLREILLERVPSCKYAIPKLPSWFTGPFQHRGHGKHSETQRECPKERF